LAELYTTIKYPTMQLQNKNWSQWNIKKKKRFHLIPVRMATFKSKNNKCWGCGKTGALIHYWWECKLVQPLWKAVWRSLKSWKIELPYDPVIPLLGIYPKAFKSRYNRDTFTSMFFCSTIHNSQAMETIQMPYN
jgi:hypothetical protein